MNPKKQTVNDMAIDLYEAGINNLLSDEETQAAVDEMMLEFAVEAQEEFDYN